MKLDKNYVNQCIKNAAEDIPHMFIGTDQRIHLFGAVQLVGGRSVYIQLHYWAHPRNFHFFSVPKNFEEKVNSMASKRPLTVICNNKDEFEYFMCHPVKDDTDIMMKFKGREHSNVFKFVRIAIDDDAETIIFMEQKIHEIWRQHFVK